MSNTMSMSWSPPLQHIKRRPPLSLKLDPVYSNEKPYSDNECSNDRKYPDLLDVSRLTSASDKMNTAYSTFPRKKNHIGRKFEASSNNQSPLYAEKNESSSETSLSATEASGRRISDSIHPIAKRKSNNRSSGFINIESSNKRDITVSSADLPAKKSTSKVSEIPLLDFTNLTKSRKQVVVTKRDSPSTSSTYDYHAAQLERFLMEYRTLQEQLSKMKETCDSICDKESSQLELVGNSAKYADPVMYTAALAATTGSKGAVKHVEMTATNNKRTLKTKTLLPGQPPDPPPYWLHRSAMLKRLQESHDKFFYS